MCRYVGERLTLSIVYEEYFDTNVNDIISDGVSIIDYNIQSTTNTLV